MQNPLKQFLIELFANVIEKPRLGIQQKQRLNEVESATPIDFRAFLRRLNTCATTTL